jgi:hypothetical protein
MKNASKVASTPKSKESQWGGRHVGNTGTVAINSHTQGFMRLFRKLCPGQQILRDLLTIFIHPRTAEDSHFKKIEKF